MHNLPMPEDDEEIEDLPEEESEEEEVEEEIDPDAPLRQPIVAVLGHVDRKILNDTASVLSYEFYSSME